MDYFSPLTSLALADEDADRYELNMDNDKLLRMLADDLPKHASYWNQPPFEFQKTDEQNVKYLLGDQVDERAINRRGGIPYKDNRVFTAHRGVLAHSSARVAMPDVSPSQVDEKHVQFARDVKYAMHQHGVDNGLESLVRLAAGNLISRKRGFLKLRFDPNVGPYGDIVVENVDPSDIIVSRFAAFMANPPIVYHRMRCTVEELIADYPDKEKDIRRVLGVQRGVHSQMTRQVTKYEGWFTAIDDKKQRVEGMCTFLPEKLVLEKQANPNFIRTGNPQQDKLINFLPIPPKPFIQFNYINFGRSFLDETSLLDQAKPQQDLINKRGKQIWENAEKQYGKIIANKNVISEGDLNKLLARTGPSGVGVDAEDLERSLREFKPNLLPDYVVETLYDARNEVNYLYGTSNILLGQQEPNAKTLGENMMIKQQGNVLQDDLAKMIDQSMTRYYRLLLHMMKVYYTDDHWFYIKGSDGKFDAVMLNSENIDTNVKIRVQSASTLPMDKAGIQETAMALAKLPGRIDNLSLYEALEWPDPEKVTERTTKEVNDPASYLQDVQGELFDREASIDIELILSGREPTERDDYPQGYLEFVNKFIMSNRFAKLDTQSKQAIMSFLQTAVIPSAGRTEALGSTQQDDAAESGMTEEQVVDEAGVV